MDLLLFIIKQCYNLILCLYTRTYRSLVQLICIVDRLKVSLSTPPRVGLKSAFIDPTLPKSHLWDYTGYVVGSFDLWFCEQIFFLNCCLTNIPGFHLLWHVTWYIFFSLSGWIKTAGWRTWKTRGNCVKPHFVPGYIVSHVLLIS